MIEPSDRLPPGSMLRETADGMFFIIGCGRSGTTLLQVMLDMHSQIALPNETHFFSTFYRKNRRRLGELRSRESFDRAVAEALATEHLNPLALDPARVRALAGDGPPSWPNLFLAVMASFREKRGVHRVGEKTPSHINRLEQLYAWYPEAKFITLIRDPRAVVCSYLKASFYEAFGSNPYHAINAWSNAITAHFKAAEELDRKRYMSTRYEDLIADPEGELAKVCDFLGVPFEVEMLEFHRRVNSGFLEGETHKRATFAPVHKRSKDLWRTELPPKWVALTEAVLGPKMAKLGYLEQPPTPRLATRATMCYLFLAYKARLRWRTFLRLTGVLKRPDLGGIAQTSTSEM